MTPKEKALVLVETMGKEHIHFALLSVNGIIDTLKLLYKPEYCIFNTITDSG